MVVMPYKHNVRAIQYISCDTVGQVRGLFELIDYYYIILVYIIRDLWRSKSGGVRVTRYV